MSENKVEFVMKCLWTKYDECRNYDKVKEWYHKFPNFPKKKFNKSELRMYLYHDELLCKVCLLCLLGEVGNQLKLMSVRQT